MRDPGPLLASGRDADIFEYGATQVLRRARNGRSLADEARTMTYLSAQGFPVPEVAELSDDGAELVMERIVGPSLVDAVGQAPWRVREFARMLARLHNDLHALSPPVFLAAAPVGAGSSIIHLDLHPLNVIVGRRGPVVIDWTGASLGDPNVDVGVAWILMAAAAIPGGGLRRSVLGLGRSLMVGGFVREFDRAAVAASLRAVVAWKATDPHMSASEVRAMWRVVEDEERHTPRSNDRPLSP